MVRTERDGPIAIVIIDNPPVNASSIEIRRGLLEAISIISGDPAIHAAILIGAGKTFVAGSDIKEFGKPLEAPQTPAVIAAIQNCPKPFVAAIHGAALGGGFELALGCDARVAAKGSVVGFPEVHLGMIPGAGGTQFLPRLIGTAAAIEMICTARRIGTAEAFTLGLVDAVTETENLRRDAIAFAANLGGVKRPLRNLSVPAGDIGAIEGAATAALQKGRNRPQISGAIEAIRWAATTQIDEGLAKERALFQKLRNGTEAAALRYLFFAERSAAKVPDVDSVAPHSISRVGVVGAGTMGMGIAMCFADTGFAVTLADRDEETVRRGLSKIQLAYDRMAQSGRIDSNEVARRMARITPAAGIDPLADCNLVVEAAFEDMAVKTELFQNLDRILSADAILASNTSYLDLDQIAAATHRPEKIVGLHFFNPAHIMKLLEVVRGAKTSPQTLATALDIAKRLRKITVVARVGEGFIGNRIYAAYRRQCEFMLEEGAFPEDIDCAITDFGFAMGPFAVADASGLDIAWQMRKRLAATRDARARYVEIPDWLCERGRLGIKTGAGWYRYRPGERKGEPDAAVRALILETLAAKGIARRAFTAPEIVNRVLITMINESALLLDEGIAARASDIDLVLVNGYGFPNYEGGPLFWAKRQNRDWLLAEAEKLQAISGFGFRLGDIAGLLTRLSREE